MLKTYMGKQKSSPKMVLENWIFIHRKMNYTCSYYLAQKSNSKWITDLNVKPETARRKYGQYPINYVCIGKYFLIGIPFAEELETSIDK